MTAISIRTVSLFVLIWVLGGCAGRYAQFGEPMKLHNKDTVPVSEVLADPAAYDGKFVRLAGVVDSVCAARGCWIRVAPPDGGESVFVKFTCPVDGRLVPMEAKGRRAVVEGTITVQEISEDEARHYKEDAGASTEEIARIVGPQKTVRMQSPAARIEGVDVS